MDAISMDVLSSTMTRPGSSLSSSKNIGNNNTIQLQPPGPPPRSSSLPGERPFRPSSTSGLSRMSIDSNARTASPTRSQGPNSPTFPMASPVGNKRQPMTSASHPYQRPASGGHRTNSGDQVSSNLARYSQSLIMAQSQQLSGRASQQQQQQQQPQSLGRQASYSSTTSSSSARPLAMPTSMPVHYATSGIGNTPFQLQPPLAHTVPSFRQPDYGSGPQELGSPVEYVSTAGVYGRLGTATPESICYSPIFQPDMYSVGTPELVSSDSVSTLDSRSSLSLGGGGGCSGMLGGGLYGKQQQPQQQLPYVNQPYVNQQAFMGLEYCQTGAAPLIDPNQWTPGVDKFANQWLQFSPQQTEQFF